MYFYFISYCSMCFIKLYIYFFGGGRGGGDRTGSVYVVCTCVVAHQLLFQVWRTSGSLICLLSACSSRKSNMYLMARGRALPRWAVLNTVSNKSSTNFCNVPWSCAKHSVQLECYAPLNTHTVFDQCIGRYEFCYRCSRCRFSVMPAEWKTHYSHTMQPSSASCTERSLYSINTAAYCTQF